MKTLHIAALSLCAATLLYAVSTRAEENKNTLRVPSESAEIKGIPLPEASGGIWMPTNGSTQKTIFAQSIATPVATVSAFADIVVYASGKEAFRMTGFKSVPVPPEPPAKPGEESHLLRIRPTSELVAPEKPEEIAVTLVTKDGRKWNAKWEEAK